MTFAADALAEDATVQASDNQISSISELANLQLTLERKAESMEAELKKTREHLKKVQEVQLPEAMALAGVTEFKLTNGTRITVKEDLSVSVPKSRMGEIASWLRTNGLGDILKETMTVSLDDEQKTGQLREWLIAAEMTADTQLTVNTSTLKAVLREQIAEGKDVDLKLMGAYAWKRAIITAPVP